MKEGGKKRRQQKTNQFFFPVQHIKKEKEKPSVTVSPPPDHTRSVSSLFFCGIRMSVPT
jgi:hypothetical protein